MPPTSVAQAEYDNVGELVRRLGGVPASRILLKPSPGLASEGDLLEVLRHRLLPVELVDGVLVEKAMGSGESLLAGWILLNFGQHILENDLGCAQTEAGLVRLRAGLVRAPDLAFFRWDTLPNREQPTGPILEVIPDLAVEILSPSNTAAEMDRKRGEYFEAGVEAVWIIDPVKRTVAVYTDPETSTTLTEADTLEGGPVLPGLNMPVSRIFDRRAPKKPSRRKKS